MGNLLLRGTFLLRGPVYFDRLTLIPVWISNCMASKVWDEIIYPFPNDVEVWEWISNFIPRFIMDVVTYPCKLIHIRKRGPWTNVANWVPVKSMVSHSKSHDDVIKWKHFPRYLPFVRGIHRSPVNSPHKGQWRGALMFSLICVWINGWVNNREAGD